MLLVDEILQVIYFGAYYFDLSATRSELNSVRNQIKQNLLNSLVIRTHMVVVKLLHLKGKGNSIELRLHLLHFSYLFYGFLDTESCCIYSEFSRPYLSEV